MASNNGGGNPRFGRDLSGLPPGIGQVPMNMYSQGQVLRSGLPYQQNPAIQYLLQQPYGGTFASPLSLPASGQLPSMAQGQGPQPQLDKNFRTCGMRNSTGGYGCEPGYNYFFPTEHTKIHVLKTGSTPPWQLPANFAVQFHACHVPVSTTVAELMKGFGARNPIPKKNVITEVCPGGGGKWYKGIEISGDDFPTMALPIKDLGWDASRTGMRGEKKVVYIYVQKD